MYQIKYPCTKNGALVFTNKQNQKLCFSKTIYASKQSRVSTTIWTDGGVNFVAGPQVEEVVGMRAFVASCVACLVLLLSQILGIDPQPGGFITSANAQAVPKSLEEGGTDAALRIRKNNWTVGVAGGQLTGTYMTFANELAEVLDDGDNLRILPMVGAGGGRNIRDLRFMKGVDLAITQTNVLAQLRAGSDIGPLDDKIVYLAKLFNAEMHVLVRVDSGLAGIEQLGGRTVALGETGGGTQLIAHDVLGRLGITAREVAMPAPDAIDRLMAGNVDAVVVIGGRPVPALARLPVGLRLLPVPFAKPLRDDFLPAVLSSEDYPELIEPDRPLETLAVGTVLIAYNWPKDSDRYRKIAKFVEAFFPQIGVLQATSHHAKWREVNLAATLPGWTRFAAAEDWLAQHRATADIERERFERFVTTRSAQGGVGQADSAADRERLFRDYQQWSDAQTRR
jgi:uncharacterized protein